jgi:hypothetical protein
MALKKCSECGHEISDRAVACPQCGCPTGVGAQSPQNGRSPRDASGENGSDAWRLLRLGILLGLQIALLLIMLSQRGCFNSERRVANDPIPPKFTGLDYRDPTFWITKDITIEGTTYKAGSVVFSLDGNSEITDVTPLGEALGYKVGESLPRAGAPRRRPGDGAAQAP